MTDITISETKTQSPLLTKDMNKGEQINTSSGQSLTPAKDITSLRTMERTVYTMFTFAIAKTIGKNGLTNDVNDNGDNSISIGAVIGGILDACSMIIVLAAMVRSKGIFTESNTHNYEDTSRVYFSTTTYEDLDKTNHKSLTATSNQTCDIDESIAPVYEEVNENKKPGNIISK
ncbi:unnamed protein product [Mytilus coruscus]|uniref:Uncharacterized protein n=1 Tax=Mytilus coruscus TaxID=42192 RepID=A0A6J8DY44_MYTCO|nr:unnamed protein product [Mytilus coruscus]